MTRDKFSHQIWNIAAAIIHELPLDRYNEEVAAEIIIRAAVQAGTPARLLLKSLAEMDFLDWKPITNAEIDSYRQAAIPRDLFNK